MTRATGAGEARTAPRWAGAAVAFAVLVLGLGVVGHSRTVDVDIFHEMALVRQALATGSLPVVDPFAYTSTVTPMVHHEWATGAVLYLFVVGLGLGATGLALLRALLLAVTAATTITVARRRGARWPELAVLAPVGMLLFAPGLSPVRAHLFTFLFVALLLWILEREREGEPRWLLLWPPLFVAWLNLHGGFVVGVGLLGLHTAEQAIREGRHAGTAAGSTFDVRAGLHRVGPLLLALAVSIPLLLVNPYGTDYIPYLWHGLTMARPYMTEWYPIWDPVFGAWPLVLFIVSVLAAAYAVARGGRRGRGPGLAILAVTALAAIQSVRLLPIYAVAWLAYVAPGVSASPMAAVLDRVWRRLARPAGALALVLAVLGLARLVRQDAFTVFLPTEPGEHRLLYPSGAVGYLEASGFEGNLMTPFGVGAYVSWELYPAVKVGMDSRYEVAYDPALAEEATRTYHGKEDWRPFLERLGTDAVLVPAASPLDSLLTDEAAGAPDTAAPRPWTAVFRDDAYAVYARPGVADRLPVVDRTGRPIPKRFP